jgi:glucose-6-phosphate isomerase
LRTFPQYLQQLIMESNGKSVRRDGAPVRYETSAIVWGEAGTGGQHSFHQLIHQGTSHVACDIIIAQRGSHPDQQRALVANALAQAEVFALGYDAAGDDSRSIRGNQPTTLIVTEAIDPETLGALIALYEHSVFVQGAIWGINPFDQFGVEIGKGIAAHIDRAMGTGDVSGLSDLTQTTLKALHSNDSG